ncbi:MAG: hypothetical protein IKY26_00175 [Erysipelotrichaceae bacterium]|nr:hypothetical protein [Erysipelotrichaceae bacterium]
MDGIIRLLLCGGLFVYVYDHFNIKKWLIIILMFLLLMISGLIPFENLFYRFKNVDELYAYLLKPKPISIIQGSHSDLMIEKENNGYSSRIFIKDSKGYKYTPTIIFRHNSYTFSKGDTLCVATLITNDFNDDVFIQLITNETIVYDNIGTIFTENCLRGDNKVYSAYLEGYDLTYQLFINDSLFVFE